MQNMLHVYVLKHEETCILGSHGNLQFCICKTKLQTLKNSYEKHNQIKTVKTEPFWAFKEHPDKNHAKCDSWMESLHIFLILIYCFKCNSKRKLTWGFSCNPCSTELVQNLHDSYKDGYLNWFRQIFSLQSLKIHLK